MINFILRIIAFTMTLMVLSQFFPSFYGGVFSGVAVLLLSSLTVSVKKDDNERT